MTSHQMRFVGTNEHWLDNFQLHLAKIISFRRKNRNVDICTESAAAAASWRSCGPARHSCSCGRWRGTGGNIASLLHSSSWAPVLWAAPGPGPACPRTNIITFIHLKLFSLSISPVRGRGGGDADTRAQHNLWAQQKNKFRHLKAAVIIVKRILAQTTGGGALLLGPRVTVRWGWGMASSGILDLPAFSHLVFRADAVLPTSLTNPYLALFCICALTNWLTN